LKSLEKLLLERKKRRKLGRNYNTDIVTLQSHAFCRQLWRVQFPSQATFMKNTTIL